MNLGKSEHRTLSFPNPECCTYVGSLTIVPSAYGHPWTHKEEFCVTVTPAIRFDHLNFVKGKKFVRSSN